MAHLTREEVLASGTMDPELQEAVEASPVKIEGASFIEFRHGRATHLSKLRHLYPIPGPIPDLVTETLHSIPTRDGASINVKVYQPAKGPPEGGSALFMLYHEGGWSMGDLTDEENNARLLVRVLGVVCVNVEYRLAPEHPFPTGIQDCYDALLWSISNSALIAATPKRGIVLSGSSAGGNISACLALHARDNNLSPPITGQHLIVPAVLPPTAVPPHLSHLYTSRLKPTDDPVLRYIDAEKLDAVYHPVADSPLWDPFNHKDGHKGASKKAYIQVCGLDPLRDEGVLYEARLRDAGVETKLELYKGRCHMFWTNWPEMEASKKFWEDYVQGARWLLE